MSGAEDGVKVWDIETGKLVKQICSEINAAWNVGIDDSKIVACLKRDRDTVMEMFRAC